MKRFLFLRRSLDILARIVRRPRGAIGAFLVAVIAVIALFAPWLSPYAPNQLDVIHRFAGPSLAHWLGTDQLGRDLLSRHLYGTQVAMAIALSVIAVALLTGTVLGILSTLVAAPLERLIIVFFDSVSSFPSIILALAALAVLGPSVTTIILVIALSLVPHFGRVARAQMLSVKNEPYIEAEKVLGASQWRILVRHIVPNIMTPLIVIASLDIPVVIAIEAGMSFLGLGLRPPLSSLGGLLQEGYQNMSRSVLPLMVSSTLLAFATLAFTIFGEALSDAIDPRSQRTLNND